MICYDQKIVPKKPGPDGKKEYRLVIYYRKLNATTIEDAYLLTNIVEILEQIGSAKYFSVFDLPMGFHQIELESGDIQKTAFNTKYGNVEYANAPLTFKRLMDCVLSGSQGVEMYVFLDDIVIYANTLEEHENKKWKWTSDQDQSFEVPVLVSVDVEKLILTTDASDGALGAILSQDEPGEDHPVAYMSRSFNKGQKNYLTTEKEYLAMVEAVDYFRHYLYGRHFTVFVDHEPLT
ncbi:hypothetical protein TSAR_008072 [Trichomalopsis sarcophagae]|uniref:Uncharacterized protein n=1 Tax=Trichomalopsis sarcophagae TaxID=543379 RepID=A0A232FND7_9HYME|nr:hypothetical protein TSAR_008072 [Trichomalopsis sarcophagae]